MSSFPLEAPARSDAVLADGSEPGASYVREAFDISGFRPGGEKLEWLRFDTGLQGDRSNDEGLDRKIVIPLSADPATPPQGGRFYRSGAAPTGWLLAGLFYAALATAVLLTPWTVTPPEPWPETATVVTLVFEETPPAPAPPVPPTASEPVPAPAQAVPEPPAPAIPPPPPPAPAAEPLPVPKPPPVVTAPKPRPPHPHVQAKPPREPAPPKPETAPSVAQAEPEHTAEAPPAPSPPSAAPPQVAPAPPPTQTAALPVIPPQAVGGATGNRKPDYPAEARRRSLQGRVVLHVDVSPDGKATNVRVLTSSGYSLLDQAAIAAVQQWNFIPAKQGGVPVAGSADVPVQFRMEE